MKKDLPTNLSMDPITKMMKKTIKTIKKVKKVEENLKILAKKSKNKHMEKEKAEEK